MCGGSTARLHSTSDTQVERNSPDRTMSSKNLSSTRCNRGLMPLGFAIWPQHARGSLASQRSGTASPDNPLLDHTGHEISAWRTDPRRRSSGPQAYDNPFVRSPKITHTLLYIYQHIDLPNSDVLRLSITHSTVLSSKEKSVRPTLMSWPCLAFTHSIIPRR